MMFTARPLPFLLRNPRLLLPAALLSLAIGCVQTRVSEPKRTAVEQLLLSTAADRALAQTQTNFLRGKKVFLDVTYLESDDKAYVIGTIRDTLSAGGALLMPSMADADFVVEARSGALSIDSSESLVGLPRIPLPITFTSTFEIPEVALYKTQKQFSTAKLALLIYEKQSRQHLHSSGPLVGRAHHNYHVVLGYLKYTVTSIPEKKSGLFK